MKRKKIALYDPYLDVLGGGEKHILSIVKSISENSDIDIFWDKDIYKDIKSRLNINFSTPPVFKKNIFFKKQNILQKLNILKEYDYLFYVTDGSYFFSSAKNNFIFCMIPDKNLFKMSFLSKLKTSNCRFISNSEFTKQWLKAWGISSEVIYPYINHEFINYDISTIKKEKIILSVGRFFKHLHSKRQDLLIKCFKELKKDHAMFSDYKLVLAGGVKKEDENYFLSLKKESKSDESVEFKTNISFKELFNLYKKSEIFWHIAGFGVDETKNPELAEHFGLSPLEAMAMGCITFGYNAGGLKESIDDNKNGFLFNSTSELIDKTRSAIMNNEMTNKIRRDAKKIVSEKFSISAFNNMVSSVINK